MSARSATRSAARRRSAVFRTSAASKSSRVVAGVPSASAAERITADTPAATRDSISASRDVASEGATETTTPGTRTAERFFAANTFPEEEEEEEEEEPSPPSPP